MKLVIVTRTLAFALVVLIASRSTVHAQPAAAQAETMFRNGKRLLSQGKIAEACAAFDASQKLEPTVSTLLNQANCREKNGQLATAWGLFLDAERDTRSSTDDDGKQLHQVAVDHAAKLESRLSTLTISVSVESHVAGLELKRGGEVLDPVMWNQALPIDGGTYKIVAHAPGQPDWTTQVTIGNEKDAKTVELPRPKVVEAAKPKVAAAAKPARVEQPDALVVPGDGETPWYCTESSLVSVGTCRPEKERCEEFRYKMIGQVQDLVPCHAAYSVVCFGLGGQPHCAPTSRICETLRGTVEEHATACLAKRVAPEPPPPPPVPKWWCTEAHSADVGICKIKRAECESFRSSLSSHRQDLSDCSEVETASCFEIGKEPHCAPSHDVCDALRTGATARAGTTATACHSQRIGEAPPPPTAARAAAAAPAVPPGTPMWWCTDSKTSDAGICKQARGDCEAFRSAMLERRHDLTECHEVLTAMCFDNNGSSHCGPSSEVCDALREAAHLGGSCRGKTLPVPAKK